MTDLAIKLALRDWRKILIIAIILAFTGSIPLYSNVLMVDMRNNSPNNLIITESDKDILRGMPTPKSRTELIVSAMSMLIVLASAMFQLNIMFIEMMNKRDQFNALKILGATEKQLELFPLIYSLFAGMLASTIIAVFWLLFFPLLRTIADMPAANLGIVLLVIVFYFAMSTIIGVKARVLSDYFSNLKPLFVKEALPDMQ